MAGVRQIKIKPEDDGLRLDRWFRKHFPALTQGRLEKLYAVAWCGLRASA